VSHDIVGRLMLMAARQPGLASVYDSILGFEGDEFYLKEWPTLEGSTFGSLQARFPEAIPLGVKQFDSNKVLMNPEDEYVCQPGDEILVLAADDNTYCVKAPMKIVDEGQVPAANDPKRHPEDILMCGWRRDVDDIIREMDTLLVHGSNLHMLNEVPPSERERKLSEGGLMIEDLKNITLIHHVGNSSVRRHMETLPLEHFDSILVLADEQRETDMMHSDSHTLATLLLIRDIQHQHSTEDSTTPGAGAGAPGKVLHHQLIKPGVGLPTHTRALSQGVDCRRESSSNASSRHLMADEPKPQRRLSWLDVDAGTTDHVVEHCLVVCEVLDHRTRNTISASAALKNSSDFVQSNEFVSRVLAMVAERREVKCVLDDLLGSTGARFCVKSSSEFMDSSESLSFFALAARVRTRREILCGYKMVGKLPIINPMNKSDTRDWQDVDLLVIADHEANASHEEADGAAASSKQAVAPSSNDGDNNIVAVASRPWGATFKAVQQAAAQMTAADRGDFLAAVNDLSA